MGFSNIYDIAGSAMRAQTVRLNTVASNLANADSVASSEQQAYHAVKPVFAAVYNNLNVNESLNADDSYAGASVKVLDVTADQQPIERRYEPDNALADQNGYVYYSNVNAVAEMADMMSASRSFETAANIINRTNSMQQSLLNIGPQN